MLGREMLGMSRARIAYHIEDNCWFGGNVVLPGVTIGNCVIGANNLVTKDIPDNSLVVGSPTKVVIKLPRQISWDLKSFWASPVRLGARGLGA